jgi:hypothetical protein
MYDPLERIVEDEDIFGTMESYKNEMVDPSLESSECPS